MPNTQTQQKQDVRFRTLEPKKYNVLIHNDDETTMEFVVHILMTIFRKTMDEAEALMWDVHTKGTGVAGTYFRDIAMSKAAKATNEARQNGFPLRLTVEEA